MIVRYFDSKYVLVHYRTKTLVLQLLAAICLVSRGHAIVLAAFENFKNVIICETDNKIYIILLQWCNFIFIIFSYLQISWAHSGTHTHAHTHTRTHTQRFAAIKGESSFVVDHIRIRIRDGEHIYQRSFFYIWLHLFMLT